MFQLRLFLLKSSQLPEHMEGLFILGPEAEILVISSSDNRSNLTPQALKEEILISQLLGPK